MTRNDRVRLLVEQHVVKAEKDFRHGLDAAKRTKPTDGFIYFVGANYRRLIKIGWTGGDPRQRLRNLQTGSASDLELLVAIRGTKDDERQLHSAFCHAAARAERTEWFTDSDRLVMLLIVLGAGMYPPQGTKRQRENLEARVREHFAWIIGRQSHQEALSEACHRAIAALQ